MRTTLWWLIAIIIGAVLATSKDGDAMGSRPSDPLPKKEVVDLVPFALAPPAVVTAGADPGVPRAAYQYQRDLVRNARVVWGLAAPVATFAAQIHQESGWRADARSKYASGLAQFTPVTADWISKLYVGELGENQPLNPSWALRALVTYDNRLWNLIIAADSCERMAMTLSSYNGGLGWLQRDIKLAREAGADTARWFGSVEHYSNRAQWAIEENRGYPRRILLKLERLYFGWGVGAGCKGIT